MVPGRVLLARCDPLQKCCRLKPIGLKKIQVPCSSFGAMFVIGVWIEVDELLQARAREGSCEITGVDIRNACVLAQLTGAGVDRDREAHPFGLEGKRNAVVAAPNRQVLPAKSVHPSGYIIERTHVVAAPSLKFLNGVMWD